MSKKLNWSRREFLQNVAGAALALAPGAFPNSSFAQSSNRSRVVIAHGVGIYSF